jgi:hypothetical protein
MAATIWADRVL